MKINVEQFESMKCDGANPVVIDVRSPGEFAVGHIPGAINIPLEEVEARLADIPLTPIVLVCHSGNRADMACQTLQSHHPEINVLEGGTSEWIASGGEVVSSSTSTWSLERQVRLAVGILVGIGTGLGAFVSPAWLILPGFIAVGLTFAAITEFCGLGLLIASMPWNRPRKSRLIYKEAP